MTTPTPANLTHAELTDTAPPVHPETGIRGVMLPVVIGTLIGAIFVTIFLALFHDPTPHRLPIGVIGSDVTAQHVSDALEKQEPDAFTVILFSSLDTAKQALEHRTVFAAVSPADATVLVAGANGPAVTAMAAETLTALIPGQPTVTDVLPSSPGDSAGLSTFYAAFGVVLAGFLFGQISYSMAPRLSLRRRLLSIGAFGLLNGIVIALIAGSIGFNALPGRVPELALVIALLAAAVAATTVAIIRLTGPAGIMISAVLLLILGNATGAGILPVPYLPEWLQWASGVLPVGVGVRAIKGVSYFHNDGLLTGIIVLAIWIAAAAAVLAAKDAIQPRRR